MKKITIFSLLSAGLLFANNALAGHGAWPPPPEAQISGSMSVLDTLAGDTLDSVALDSGQTWTFMSALAWPSTIPASVNSTTATQIFATQGWTININETYNGATGEGAASLSSIVGVDQVGMNFDLIWSNGESYNSLTQIWDVIFTDFNATATLSPVALGFSGTPGSALSGGSFDGMSLSMEFVSTVPVPAAVWLFGSGLIGLLGVARKRRRAGTSQQ